MGYVQLLIPGDSESEVHQLQLSPPPPQLWSVFLPSVSLGVQFQFIGTDNFVGANIFIVGANIFIVGNNIIVVSCMYLTLFMCTMADPGFPVGGAWTS